MLKFDRLSLRRGRRLLFKDASFIVHRGRKVGVTGVNGCGKSSLFALILGELAPDEGDFHQPPGLTTAHVAQESAADERAAVEYVMDGDHELRRLQAQLAIAEQHGDATQLGRLHEGLDAIGGYGAPARAAKLMDGLGFDTAQLQQPVCHFSGGWRMRLNLARALMCRSDLLLLDEPTNHLDLDAVLWLQAWLKGYDGTLLLISHDREFLDAVIDQVVHVEHGGIHLHTGNYTDFERYRAQRLAGQQAAYDKQQREIAHIQRYVDRFRAKASKARQAQSRLKALARMEQIAEAHVDSPFTFSFHNAEKMPHPLLRIEGVSAGYDDKATLSGINLTLEPGSRIGLLGANGAGKSTLIKLLAGALQPLGGREMRADTLRIGYFAQHQLEQLHVDESPLQHLQRLDPKAREDELRRYLGGFAFSGESALAPVAPFSGGEKARLVLALLVYQRPNLLLLDEPTNHLDLEMRHALSVALQAFSGALVVVAHDRHLLRTVTDRLLLVCAGRVSEFSGDLDDYSRWLAERRATATKDGGATTSAGQGADARKQRRRQEAESRRQLQPLRNQLKKLEQQLEQLHEQQEALETRLADTALYTAQAKDQLKAVLAEQRQLNEALAEVETQWMTVSEQLEQAQDQPSLV
ncbi:MAG: ATP-binding cassette domain-containing protein [Gammaproteobacteria bacterium]|nr:ATP-binding cassette domain-containing protein [Gammaproteobacteria bacterium]